MLAPEKDDPALGADMQRNNDFAYKEMDPHGYAIPLGSHIRRINPRDTAHNMNRRRMIRRGAPYGPPLPKALPTTESSAGSPPSSSAEPHPPVRVRAERLDQRPEIQRAGQRTRSDHRVAGRDAGVKIPKRPIRKKIVGLPAFTTVKGGAYFFLPGLRALGYLASLNT